MFFGTKMWFKLLYFITAMSPAYILYSFYLYALPEKGIFNETLFYIPVIPVILVLLFLVIGYLIKKSLIKETRRNENPYTLRNIKQEIVDQNGTSLVFLLGVIIPSAIYVDDSILINFIIFLLIQFLLFTLMINTTTLFPNIILIIFKVHSFKLKSGRYLISNQPLLNKTIIRIEATAIGDNSNTLCYVIKE